MLNSRRSPAPPRAGAPAAAALRRRELLAGLLVGGALAIGGCATRGTAPHPPSEPPPLLIGSLTELVSTARLRWLLATHPAELLAARDLRGPLSRLLRDERLELFAQTTGLDLRRVRELLVASFTDESVLLLARHDVDPRVLERLFRARLTSDEHRRVAHEQLVGVTGRTGRLGRAFVAIGPQVVGLQFGGDLRSGPARVAELYAAGGLTQVPNVASDPTVGPSWAALGEAPVRWLLPGPFDEEVAQGAHGLLRAATALGASLVAAGDGAVLLTAFIQGDFGSAPERAAELLAQTWGDMSQSDVGHLVGLGAPRDGPRTDHHDGQLRLTVTLDADALCTGLAAATMDTVREMMR